MRYRRTIWVITCLVVSACNPDERFLVHHKGVWQETEVVRHLFTGGVPSDSIRQTGGFGQYRFRNNGHGTYDSDSLSAEIDWYWDRATSELRICFQDNGILQCRLQTVLNYTEDRMEWESVNVVDSMTVENVRTGLEFME